MAYTALEDFFGDIVGKARRGLDLTLDEVGAQSGLSAADVERIESYDLTPDAARIESVAQALGLDGKKLKSIAAGWLPAHGNDPNLTDRLAVTRLILDAGMEVNCYLIKCQKTGDAVLVDAGGQPDRILACAQEEGAKVTHILLTHAHGDHTGAVRAVKKATGAQVCCGERDLGLLGGLRSDVDATIGEGWGVAAGEVEVTSVKLAGHTPGGTGYVCEGCLFSGDAMFAGSLGGATGPAYQGQIRAVAEGVLRREAATRIFPGHGPITTVAEECAHNPFFRS